MQEKQKAIRTDNYRTFVANHLMAPVNPKQARFDTRLSAEQKQFFETAASLSGFKSLSEFVLHATQQAAMAIVTQHRHLQLSHKDSQLFFDALIKSPKPNAALKKAARKYKKAALAQ
jgi:uncharacterized protein (DUF1778 family)